MLAAARALVRMPDLVGMQFGKAKLILENAGLIVDYVVYDESYEARNTVLAQAPQRGQMIYAGDRVAVAVSRDSYVRWLPAIYQRSDLAGRNFVKELLWITQHLFGSVEEILNLGHTYYDPYEAPERFLPWLASWTAMVLEEDWPVAKKRRLIKRAVDLYRIRGTLRGLKLFISLFTGHEPEIRENEWPFRGWRIGVTSAIGIDTVVLPPVNLSHTFVVEMPTAYQDLSPESVIRIHEIVRMEKPAHAQYYLRFAAERRDAELREFYVIGARSGIGIGQEIIHRGDIGDRREDEVPAAAMDAVPAAMTITTQLGVTKTLTAVQAPDFPPPTKTRRPLPKAPRADLAPVEGREVRSREEGFGVSARQLSAVDESRAGKPAAAEPTASVAPVEPPTDEDPPFAARNDMADTTENELDPDDADPPTKIAGPKRGTKSGPPKKK